MSSTRLAAALLGAALFVVGCGNDDGAPLGQPLPPPDENLPGFGAVLGADDATYVYTIPAGAGEAIDAGEPLTILPRSLTTTVGQTIKIVNEDNRGHTVGPWFVGANETLRQEFTTPGSYEGLCTVHPSGEFILQVLDG